MTKSMTAFSKKQTQKDIGIFSWEIRSLNSRYLDVHINVPEIFRELEFKLRDALKKHVKRGKIDCTLRYQAGTTLDEQIEVATPLVNKLHQAIQKIEKVFGKTLTTNTLDILKWPGVIHTTQGDTTHLYKITLSLFNDALSDLNIQKNREGEKLAKLIHERLKKMQTEVKKVRKHLPAISKAHREQLITRFKTLELTVDPTRLEQEMVFIAQKMDVAEELDRLETHITEIEKILKTEGETGRRLDFFMQELNREANTLGSKSINEMTSTASVTLKVLIEEMREQVQNIE